MKKFVEMTDAQLAAARDHADAEILRLKGDHAPEEGPILAALRVRRSEILGEIARRLDLLEAA